MALTRSYTETVAPIRLSPDRPPSRATFSVYRRSGQRFYPRSHDGCTTKILVRLENIQPQFYGEVLSRIKSIEQICRHGTIPRAELEANAVESIVTVRRVRVVLFPASSARYLNYLPITVYSSLCAMSSSIANNGKYNKLLWHESSLGIRSAT
ncbi:hypothetical protein P152DRAFT_151575 [Eremomyces bilateralis CBS 781.70]|uniref:Uncharacterized protein n=1 Tax=Eremomyces bilateralis CBS 781.70 TaxID=1392243 RepID=A0A6G1FVK1_9PEZI|nr:uncharacterized protein P152DRAFT_151575 [Eremomyces bilateralis CBS 781.70]KAF1809814.1 hypothetical protein P152DRAFT_151575 [Eremomyces bilateralis CBS 781.70]